MPLNRNRINGNQVNRGEVGNESEQNNTLYSAHILRIEISFKYTNEGVRILGAFNSDFR